MGLSETFRLSLFLVIRGGIGFLEGLSHRSTRVTRFWILTLEPERREDQPVIDRNESRDGLSTDAQAACCFRYSASKRTLQKLRPLSCRSFDDLESHFRGFPLKVVDLQLAVLSLVELRSFVHELHAVPQHTVDQTGQLGRHSFNRSRSPASGSAPVKW